MRRLLFLCVVFGLAGMLRAQTRPTVLVLRGGTVVDVASGKEIPDSVIVIRGDRIEQLGKVGSTGIPEGAQIVEAQGKWIVPGLIDSHAHAEDNEDSLLSLYLTNGVTTAPILFWPLPGWHAAGLASRKPSRGYTGASAEHGEFSCKSGRGLREGL